MTLMAKKNNRNTDRHSSKKMMRLDDDIHALLTLMSIDENRPMAMEVRPLLIAHLESNNYFPVTQKNKERLEELDLWTEAVEKKLIERGFWPPPKSEQKGDSK